MCLCSLQPTYHSTNFFNNLEPLVKCPNLLCRTCQASMHRPHVQEVNNRKTVITDNNRNNNSTRWSECTMQDNTTSADIVLRFAAVQLKLSPLEPHYSFNIPYLTKVWCYSCNSTYQYGEVTTIIHSRNMLCFHYFFSETILWVDNFNHTFQKHHFIFGIFFS